MPRLARGFGAMLFVAFAFATPLGGNAVGRACAAGTAHVGMVIDAGTGGKVSIICMPVGGSDNGATLLAARAEALGTPKPRYNSAGLLCAIDGVPATGCGEHTGGHFAYWSYWHGSNGTWSYSNIGPASSNANPSVVEGWRFQPDGAGLPTDPAPRGPAEPVRICIDTPPPISYRTATTTVPPANAGTPTTRAVVGGTGNTTPTPPTAPPATNKGAATTVGATPETTVTPSTRAPASKPSAAEHETTTTFELTHGSIASGPQSKSSGGAPVGLIVGVVLVVAVGAGGAVVARRRRRPAS